MFTWHVDFATTVSVGAAGNLTQAATNAVAAAWAADGSAAARVAAVFAFNGRNYLAADSGFSGFFDDPNDLLIDVTGATGVVAARST
jgi:hypothetical protein